MAGTGQLDGSREIIEVSNRDGRLASLLQRMIDGINKVATNSGTSAVGRLPAPKSPDSVQVSVPTSGELMHISVTHNGSINQGINYFTEIATNPSFGQLSTVMIHHHGTSRTPPPIHLPTFQKDGITKYNYYVRTLAQYPGGDPSQPTVVGGLGNPTPFQMNGTTSMDLLPCNGSGTSPSNGAAIGAGFGRVTNRTK